MSEKHPLDGIVEYKEIGGEAFIKVTPENDKKVVYNSIVNNIAKCNVTNGNIEKIKTIIRAASGEFESVGPAFEIYSEDFNQYLIVKITPQKAYLLIKEECPAMRPTDTLIRFRLKKAGIVFGLMDDKIDEIINNQLWEQEFQIAEGKEPTKGEDGDIEYLISLEEDLTPEKLEDGSVDYRTVKSFAQVKKGDVVAKKKPPTLGDPGTTVTNEVVPAEPGRDYTLASAENIKVSDDGNELIVENDGVLLQDKSNQIFVRDYLEIKGDVDFHVGNINFPGKVVVDGNIHPGFTVESDNDILIHGQVEAAIIKSTEGVVQIEKGIIGKKTAKIFGKKRVNINFAQDTEIESEEIVSVSDSLLHSSVVCTNFLVESEGVSIVGGSIEAYGSIKLANIGNEDGTPTRLTLIDRVTKELIEKRKQLVEVKSQIDKLFMAADREYRSKKQVIKQAGDYATEKIQQELIKADKQFKSIKQKSELVEKNIGAIDGELKKPSSDEGFIEVKGTIFAGIKLSIYGKKTTINNVDKGKKYSVKDGDLNVTSL
jgi:uncharacterized protein (DUF342 family)